MDFILYKKLITQIGVGEKLPNAIYLHDSAIGAIPDEIKVLIDQFIREHSLISFNFNIIN